jgi:CHASE1-domain containing sensor protein
MPRKPKTAEAIETEDTNNESPRDRFLRLAPARTTAALKRIELLSNLASSNYDFTQSESAQIIEALFDAVHNLKRKFEKKTSDKKSSGFTFKTNKTASREHAA